MIRNLCPLVLLGGLVASVASAQQASAQQDSGHRHPIPRQVPSTAVGQLAIGPNGGSLKQAGSLRLETVVSQTGIHMFVYDSDGNPVSVQAGRGAASLRVDGYAKRYRYDLLPDGKGGLTVSVNLSKIAGRQIEVDIQLFGLPGLERSGVQLTEVATIPASETQMASAAIARQKICPVSGNLLGSMGDPISVDVGGVRVFVCCAGCVEAVKADPGKYLTGKPEIVVTTATKEDSALIAAQKTCPVMDEPLGSMGNPIKVMVGDKPIFLCCKGCIKKIQAEPAKYLAMVYGGKQEKPESKTASASSSKIVVTSATRADAALIAKQKVCPVMDEPLGSMGNPIKVMVGDRPIFLCCRGCIKKIQREPAKYLAMVYGSNQSVPIGTKSVRPGVFKVTDDDLPFVAAQKICPVMEEPLRAMGGPYKVHANGKAIYICCPGCAKLILAEPDKYLAILAEQGVNSPILR